MKNQMVISGRDRLAEITGLMEKLDIRRPLIVGGSQTGRLMKKVPALLNSQVFSGYHSNPDLADAEGGAELFRNADCDGIISIGGGSSIDTAKAVKMLLNTGSMDKIIAGEIPERLSIPHIAVPGTAGSGAEATQNAVVYLNNSKFSLTHTDLRPEGVVLDSSLLDTLPLYHKKSCALDALSQGIESFWSVSSTPDSQVHAWLAVIGILDNLKNYIAGDPHASDELMDASYQSGKAIQITRTTAAHAMSYQITKKLGPAHGHACLLTLPVHWDYMNNMEEMRPVLKDLSEKMRLGDPLLGPKLLRGIMIDLEMEIPPMPDKETLDFLTDSVNVERLGNHPVRLSKEDIRQIYIKAFTPVPACERQACLDIWNYYGR